MTANWGTCISAPICRKNPRPVKDRGIFLSSGVILAGYGRRTVTAEQLCDRNKFITVLFQLFHGPDRTVYSSAMQVMQQDDGAILCLLQNPFQQPQGLR